MRAHPICVLLPLLCVIGCAAPPPPPPLRPALDPIPHLARAAFLQARRHYQELHFRKAERELERAVRLAPDDLQIQDLYRRVVYLTHNVEPWEPPAKQLAREARFQESMALLLGNQDEEGAARARWRAAFLRARLEPSHEREPSPEDPADPR